MTARKGAGKPAPTAEQLTVTGRGAGERKHREVIKLSERPPPPGTVASSEPPPPEITEIIDIFRKSGIEPAPRDVETLPHLLAMARAHPREFLDSDEYKQARLAMQALERLMPKLIDRAQTLAAPEAGAARPAWLDRYAAQARTLLDAIEPFTLDRRNKVGWWHGWARMIGVEIGVIFGRARVAVSYDKDTAPAAVVMFELLALIDDSIRPSDIKNIMRPKGK